MVANSNSGTLKVIMCVLFLTVLFYFIDPLDFIQKLGYAILVLLSLLELFPRVHHYVHSKERDSE